MKTKVRGGCREKRQRWGNLILSGTRVLFLMLILSAFCTETHAQKRIDLQVTNQPLLRVLDVLQEQSGFSFLFSSEDVRGVEGVTVNLKNASLEDALNQVLKGTALRYEINDGVVVFHKRLLPQRTAQLKNKEIVGWVTDRKKVPLENVNVVVKGRNIGTTTNKDGKFGLQFASLDDFVLEVSYMGMKKKEVKY
ncbi:MAG: secretin and TonB N-terminal domain-containing protein, partial [Odoribacter sp.]|nr:secretin and TonB N-terminal domain-containing protein [Odoribacter sp.]